MKRILWTTVCAITAVHQAFAEESRTPNPADLTEAAAHVEIMPEYDNLTDGEAFGVRAIADYDWAEGKYSLTAEILYAEVEFDDGVRESGIGDLRLRGFWKFYDSPESTLESMVFNLDVFAPTGDDKKGLGLGTYLLVPSVIFAVPVSDVATTYLVPKYKISTDKTLGRSSAFSPGKTPLPGRETEEYINAIEFEAGLAYSVPQLNAWGFLAPIVEIDLEPEPDEDNYELTLRGQIGKMFGQWGLGLEGTTFLAGEKSQNFQGRLIYYWYF